MTERGLKALQPKTYVPKTSDGRADKPSPNLLLDHPLPELPNRVWAGDITFIPTSAGWIYLAVVIDLCSRKIVGWALANHMRAELVSDALKQALGSRDTVPDLIFHSDRGSQYCSHDYQKILREHGLQSSMSGKGNCYDNAVVETFFKTIKAELVWRRTWETRRQAETTIFQYINGFYNPRRRHSALGGKSPLAFERQAA
jgi:transposase InsO family protein